MADRYDDGSWGGQGDPQRAAQDVPTQQLVSLNSAVAADPTYQSWLSAHGGGQRNLTDSEKSQLTQLLQSRGLWNIPGTEVSDRGGIVPISHTTKAWLLIAAVSALPTAAAIASIAGGGAAVAPALGGGDTISAGLGTASALPSLTVPTATAAGAGAGASAAGPLLGGGDSLASNLPASSALVGAPASLTSPLTTAGANVANGSMATSPQWSIPGAGTYAGDYAGTGSGTGGAALPGAGNSLGSIGQALKQIGIPLALAAGGRALSPGGDSGSGGGGNLPPELQQLLAMSLSRMQEQQPLFSAVTRQAYAGLPSYAKGG